MNGREAIKLSLQATKDHLDWMVADFSDADLLVRPIPEANHAAWQIGNVIFGDVMLIKSEFPDSKMPELPAGFDENHGTPGATSDDPAKFLSKSDYLTLLSKSRAATIETLMSLTDDDLDGDTKGSMKSFCPKIAHLFLTVANHTTMHSGQFTVIRRKLGKPVLF
ncbi:hypothetical protein Psta_3398 [Pirellula staleyi DSM 6068]|uniref:DinB-like domain-containing protein n=1 Tax=Pirellula staleyi (strain ATCC 27377 / DSM 6068 / ICPB 4128) TaxID=530564 RepID=D2QXY5_PIRSD|nr:DinB family protein [Pirellula staleyi]ADB18062.1 hypothetical protein Psta_3398 [Pirellula staleyi DSM 6068]